MTVPSTSQRAQSKRPDLHALQFADRMSDPCKHISDLVLFAFAEDDFVPRIGRLRAAGSRSGSFAAWGPEGSDGGREGAASREQDTLAQLVEVFCGWYSADLRPVGLGNTVSG